MDEVGDVDYLSEEEYNRLKEKNNMTKKKKKKIVKKKKRKLKRKGSRCQFKLLKSFESLKIN